MTGVDSWSTTAATNATADGGSINFAEGQSPGSVNNSARQLMADVRSAWNDVPWFQYGSGDQGSGNIAKPCVYASSTSFTIAGVDVTAAHHANRRVRAVGVSTGTIYGRISSSSFSTNTTVNVVWDSGSLSNETLVVSLGLPYTGISPGFLGMPSNGQTTSLTLALGDRGKKIYLTGSTTSQGVTVPANATVAFSAEDTVITIINGASVSWSVIQAAAVTLIWAGQGNITSTGNRTFAAGGICTLIKVATNTWFVSGVGLT